MGEEDRIRLEQELAEVPFGTLRLEGVCPSEGSAWDAQVDLGPQGRGRGEIFSLFPGVHLVCHRFLAKRVSFCHPADRSVLEITYCRRGRAGWNLKGGAAVYLGPGDLFLRTTDCCAGSQMELPLGCYEGVTVALAQEEGQGCWPAVLEEAGVTLEGLCRIYCGEGQPAVLPASYELEEIFAPLYRQPPALRLPYCRLKVQELLLYLWGRGREAARGTGRHLWGQAQQIREIHELLVQNLDRRFTIEELSRRYLIDASSLKRGFKAVYGQPIASYMKEYRVRRAMELLRTTGDPIAQIAAQVGYESQGKFTRAFQDVTHLLPKEYRKLALTGGAPARTPK